jgi:hypothetical protein
MLKTISEGLSWGKAHACFAPRSECVASLRWYDWSSSNASVSVGPYPTLARGEKRQRS